MQLAPLQQQYIPRFQAYHPLASLRFCALSYESRSNATYCIPTPAAGQRVLGKNASASQCACLARNQSATPCTSTPAPHVRRSASQKGAAKQNQPGSRKGGCSARTRPLHWSCPAVRLQSAVAQPASDVTACSPPRMPGLVKSWLPAHAKGVAVPGRTRARRHNGSPAALGGPRRACQRRAVPRKGQLAAPRVLYDVTANCTVVGMSPCARPWMALPATSVVPAPLVICTSSGDAGSALPSHTAP